MCVGIFVHPTIAFIGLYGVQPELHGRGIGIAMWKRMMDHIGSLNAGLYAVPEHLTMYRDRAGFQNPDDRMLIIYESDQDDHLNVDILVNSIPETKIHLITTEWYNKVIDYDAHVHGYIRAKLLPHVFNGNINIFLKLKFIIVVQHLSSVRGRFGSICGFEYDWRKNFRLWLYSYE